MPNQSDHFFPILAALIAGTAKGGTQLIVQNPKNLQQSTVTVQQLMRPQNNYLVGKRIINMQGQANARQIQVTILHFSVHIGPEWSDCGLHIPGQCLLDRQKQFQLQIKNVFALSNANRPRILFLVHQVVSAASGLATGTIRTNVTNPQTIKVSASTTPQQAIFSVLQQQQMQRQNANQVG